MKTTHVYVDGSLLKETGKKYYPSVGGIGVYFGKNDSRNVSKPFFTYPLTNNRTELDSSIHAIENFMDDKIKRKDKSKEKLVIHTDSQYVINSITKWIKKWKVNRWKTSDGKDVLNKDLLYNLDGLLNFYKEFLEVEFIFVKAHRDPPKNKKSVEYKEWFGNDMADRLAKRGTTMSMLAIKNS